MNTSVLGVSDLELHSSGTNPVTFFGHNPRFEGEHNFRFGGGTSSDLGSTAPEFPPWHRACHDVMIVAEVCVYNTEKL